MKRLLRSFAINVAALWLVNQAFPGALTFAKQTETLLVTAFVLGLVNLFIRPLINLFLLPINLLTLGTFRWLVNVFTLYLVTLIVTDFSVNPFFFPGFSYQGLVIPAISLGAFGAFILVSLCLAIFSSFLFWLCK